MYMYVGTPYCDQSRLGGSLLPVVFDAIELYHNVAGVVGLTLVLDTGTFKYHVH